MGPNWGAEVSWPSPLAQQPNDTVAGEPAWLAPDWRSGRLRNSGAPPPQIIYSPRSSGIPHPDLPYTTPHRLQTHFFPDFARRW
jgi:hypothetical protein